MLFFVLASLLLHQSVQHSCFNTLCWGEGESTENIPCNHSTHHCTLNTQHPVCVNGSNSVGIPCVVDNDWFDCECDNDNRGRPSCNCDNAIIVWSCIGTAVILFLVAFTCFCCCCCRRKRDRHILILPNEHARGYGAADPTLPTSPQLLSDEPPPYNQVVTQLPPPVFPTTPFNPNYQPAI